MEKRFYELTSHFLSLAGDEFSNHGCNDIDKDLFNDWSNEEKIKFLEEFHDWNGSSDDFDKDEFDEKEDMWLADWQIFDFLSDKFSNLAKK